MATHQLVAGGEEEAVGLDRQRADNRRVRKRLAGAVVQEERAHDVAGRFLAPILLHLLEERPGWLDLRR